MASPNPITVSLSFSGLTLTGAQDLLVKARSVPMETASAETEAPAKKRGRPSKAEIAAREAAEAEDESETAEAADESEDEDEYAADESEEADEPEDDEDEADDEEPEEKPRKGAVAGKLTLEKHIIPAFQAYVKKHDREKAVKVLAKFKVKNVKELPASKYAEVIKALR